MIRQAISCDICSREMQNPNHWFVVYDRGAELRVIRWGMRPRLRASARHLCGQTCLHKLVDEFMARPAAQRDVASPEETGPAQIIGAGLVMPGGSFDDFESSARLVPSTERDLHLEPAAPSLTLIPRGSAAEAWKREREREERAAAERLSQGGSRLCG